MLTVCVNTCALGPRAKVVTGSHSGTPHALREHALRTLILPSYTTDPRVDEVIVVGEWEEGEDFTYLHVPSVHFSAVDALAQRQAAFEASSGDVVLFVHDDHMLDPAWSLDGWTGGVLVPERVKMETGAPLPSGRYGEHAGRPYIGGHAAFYRREVIQSCPWGAVEPVFTWDLHHTKAIVEAGYEIEWSDTVRVFDVEVECT